jgi:cysteine desulfurase
LHGLGIKAETAIAKAKRSILDKFETQGMKGELVFTSGATESNNLALFGTVNSRRRYGNKIVASSFEHPSVEQVLTNIEKNEPGFEVVRVPPDDIETNIIKAADERTVLVTAMSVNNETGFLTDTPRIYTEIKRKFPECIVHCDAVQGFLRTPVKADLITFCAHKIHGIKGIGALFVSEGVRIAPQTFARTFGGGQQKNIRPGTEPAPLIVSFAKAVTEFSRRCNESKLWELHNLLAKNLREVENTEINSKRNFPSILNFSVPGIPPETLVHFFEEHDIYLSSGSACSSKSNRKYNRILRQFGAKYAENALRISFSEFNTTDEIDIFTEKLKCAVKRFKH